MFDWLVVNVSHSVLHWLQFGVGSVVGVACLWVVMVRTLVVIVCDVSIQRGHHCLMVLVGALVLRTVVVELNVRLDGVAAMHVFLVMSVLHWVHDLAVYDFVMVVWCLMMDIVMDLMDMGWLVVGDVVIVVYHLMVSWLNVVHVHIVVIEVVVVVVVVEAVVRVEMVVASLSEVVKLVREVLPLSLVGQPLHIFVVGVMVIVVMVCVVVRAVGVGIVAVHAVSVVHGDWVVHLVVGCRMSNGVVGKLVPVVWILSKRVNVPKISVFHGVLLSLSLPLHLAPVFLSLLFFHASLFLLLAAHLLAHLLVLLLLSEVFISMIHSVVVVHGNMVALVPVSHWSRVVVELVGVVCHGSQEAVVLLLL